MIASVCFILMGLLCVIVDCSSDSVLLLLLRWLCLLLLFLFGLLLLLFSSGTFVFVVIVVVEGADQVAGGEASVLFHDGWGFSVAVILPLGILFFMIATFGSVALFIQTAVVVTSPRVVLLSFIPGFLLILWIRFSKGSRGRHPVKEPR